MFNIFNSCFSACSNIYYPLILPQLGGEKMARKATKKASKALKKSKAGSNNGSKFLSQAAMVLVRVASIAANAAAVNAKVASNLDKRAQRVLKTISKFALTEESVPAKGKVKLKKKTAKETKGVVLGKSKKTKKS